MNQGELYKYHGVEYSMTDLTRISHLHRDTILRRLEQGWSLEMALELPAGRGLPNIRSCDIGKKVPIVFTAELPVFDEMQPILGKQYIATVCGTKSKSAISRVFYMIELDNGKKLITYPGEFEEKRN